MNDEEMQPEEVNKKLPQSSSVVDDAPNAMDIEGGRRLQQLQTTTATSNIALLLFSSSVTTEVFDV
ncbi:hypothetical protein TYRP_005977 [Tyrophagus putrescentiae]|nr:hypothetical protein TYRP_005977 [Tyrophagus putrescentiae]